MGVSMSTWFSSSASSSSPSSISSSSYHPVQTEYEFMTIAPRLTLDGFSVYMIWLLIHDLEKISSNQNGQTPSFKTVLSRVPYSPLFERVLTGEFMETFYSAVNQDKCMAVVICIGGKVSCEEFLRDTLFSPAIANALSNLNMLLWGFAFPESYVISRIHRKCIPGFFIMAALDGKINVIDFIRLPVDGADEKINQDDFLTRVQNDVTEYEGRKDAMVTAGGNPRLFRDIVGFKTTAQVEVLTREDPRYGEVADYYQSTQGAGHIKAIVRVDTPSAAVGAHRRCLLWHGTPERFVAPILNEGLACKTWGWTNACHFASTAKISNPYAQKDFQRQYYTFLAEVEDPKGPTATVVKTISPTLYIPGPGHFTCTRQDHIHVRYLLIYTTYTV